MFGLLLKTATPFRGVGMLLSYLLAESKGQSVHLYHFPTSLHFTSLHLPSFLPSLHSILTLTYSHLEIVTSQISSSYPTNLHLLIHLSGTQPFAPDSSTSSSSSSASPHVKSYSYPKALVGFAEHDLETFDKIAAGLAWTRTLATLRTAFKRDRDDGNGGLEGVRERYVENVFGQKKDAQGVMGMVGQVSSIAGDFLFLFLEKGERNLELTFGFPTI